MKLRKKYFTLFEILISAALLIIVAGVLLRMFVLTGDYWLYSENQANVYLDSKVLFNLLDEELSNIVYDTAGAAKKETIYTPLYYQNDYNLSTGGMTIKYYNGSDSDAVELNKAKAICFVTRTWRGNNSEYSNLCKVSYIFYPPLAKSSPGHNFSGAASDLKDEKYGMIVRIVHSEDDDTSFAGGQSSIGDYFNFDLKKAQMVLNGVLDFHIAFFDNDLKEISPSNSAEGYKGVRAIRITIVMIPTEKCTEYREKYQDRSETEQRDFLQKYSRTFSRMFWVNPLKGAN